MENPYSPKVKIARFLLKLMPIPIVAMAVLERFTIPPISLWAIFGVIVLCLIALILAYVGDVSFPPKK
jgi:uncharacterized membrane protein